MARGFKVCYLWPMSSRPYQSADVRAECRETLVRELLLRTFSHDVRGAVMGVMGWVELMAMEGTTVPQGLSRSMDKLNHTVSLSDDAALNSPLEVLDIGPLLRDELGITVEGEGVPAAVSPLRLLAAMELTAPSAVALSTDVRGGRLCLRVRIEGLSAEAVQLAMAPHFETLLTLIAQRDAAVGASLLRVVARTGGAELRGEPPNRINLYFPLP